MAKGILGRKIGMIQIFNAQGQIVPVTVIDVTENVILQQKTIEKDSYVSTQIGFDSKKPANTNKPEQGHVKAANTAPKRFVKEIRFDERTQNELSALPVGTVLDINLFKAGDVIDVTGTSKGKGFQGNIKRHNQSRGSMSHGSRYHRGPGSLGAIKGKVKGKNLPGQMGNETVTIQNLEIVGVNAEQQVLLVSGSVPGPKNGLVVIKTAVKSY